MAASIDNLVQIAWRAFWVGLGASGVLIAQTLASAHSAAPPSEPPGIEAPAPASPAVARLQRTS